VTVALIVGPDAEMFVIATHVFWPAYDFVFGVDVALSDVLPALPG
jgi:hypothetical protein